MTPPDWSDIPRGIRNNNPLNIKDFGIAWQGLVPMAERDPWNAAERTFCVYRLPHYGIRAAARILTNYHRKRGLRTVRAMIGRFAPKGDHNDVDNYARLVAGWMGVRQDEELPLTFTMLCNLLPAMIRVECGQQPYSWEIQSGVMASDIEPAGVIYVPASREVEYEG